MDERSMSRDFADCVLANVCMLAFGFGLIGFLALLAPPDGAERNELAHNLGKLVDRIGMVPLAAYGCLATLAMLALSMHSSQSSSRP
jgi:hypothetical protein